MSLGWTWLMIAMLSLGLYNNYHRHQINQDLVERLTKAQDSNLVGQLDDALKQQGLHVRCEVIDRVQNRDLWACETPIGGLGKSLNRDVAYARALLNLMELSMLKSLKEFLMDDTETLFDHGFEKDEPMTEEELLATGADEMFDFDWEEGSSGPFGQQSVRI